MAEYLCKKQDHESEKKTTRPTKQQIIFIMANRLAIYPNSRVQRL